MNYILDLFRDMEREEKLILVLLFMFIVFATFATCKAIEQCEREGGVYTQVGSHLEFRYITVDKNTQIPTTETVPDFACVK